MSEVDVIYRYQEQDDLAKDLPDDVDAALQRLNLGNAKFARLSKPTAAAPGPHRHVIAVDIRDLDSATRPQRPFAAVLGCSDARVPIEMLFGQGPNDLFVVRIAGNSLGPDVLGSLRYAADHLHETLKLIVVLGHSDCGAIRATVKMLLQPNEYLSLTGEPALRSLMDRHLLVVEACARKLGFTYGPEITAHPSYRDALIDSAVMTNAALSAYSIQHELDKEGRRDLRAAYGVYHIEQRAVATPLGQGLAMAPRSAEEFTRLGDRIARSERLKAMLNGQV